MKAELKNMSTCEILAFQIKVEKELCSRFDNLINTLTTIIKIQQKVEDIENYYNKVIYQLKENNLEINQLEEMGFFVNISEVIGSIGIMKISRDTEDYYSYGCDINLINRNIDFWGDKNLETSDLEKIKEILKLN
jgi:hypothetical protein